MIISCIRITEKSNYFMDEITNFGIANNYNGFSLTISEGKKYVPSYMPFYDYLSVSEYNRFNYENVYKNTAWDVHPPLYYDLLHTICSIFPETFSKWYAGFINIVFIISTFIITYKLLYILPPVNKNNLSICLILIIFIFSKGIANSTVFLRMYTMAMFWCTSLTYILIKDVLSENKINLRFFIALFFVALFGALTHYYCIIFTVASCLIYGLIILKNKSFKKFFILVLSGIFSGLSAYILFPEMVKHMFTGYRGTESIENLNSSLQESLTRFQQYDEYIDIELFGGLFLYIFSFSLCIILFLLIKKYVTKDLTYNIKKSTFIDSYFLIFLPVIIYFIFVGKSSVYITDRYMFPVFPLILAGYFSMFFALIDQLFSKHKIYAVILEILISILVIIFNYSNPKYKEEYMYKYTIPILENAKNHSDYDSLFIYDENGIWNCYSSLLEATIYNSFTFINKSDLEILPYLEISDNNKLAVFIPNNENNILDVILETYPQYVNVEKNGSFWDYTSYFLSSDIFH